MKRLVIAFVIIVMIPFPAYGADYEDVLSGFDLSSFDELDSDTLDYLDQLGLRDFDYESLLNLSLDDIASIIGDIFRERIKKPFTSLLVLFAMIILSSFFRNFSDRLRNSSMQSVYSTVSALVIAVFLISKLNTCLSLCNSTISVCADFIYAFIPALCIIVATAGGTLTSLSTNTLLMLLSQGLNFLSDSIFMPLIHCFFALGICSSLREELHFSGVIGLMKKGLTTGLSLVSGAFVSILSIKTAVASRTDALGLRSVRFAINSVVPVIGSAISEGLLSIQSYSSLIKSSVGVVGIIAVFLIFLPSLADVTVWRCCLSVSAVICEAFDDKSVTLVLKAFKDGLLLIHVLLILSMVTTIISIGVLVAAKTTA